MARFVVANNTGCSWNQKEEIGFRGRLSRGGHIPGVLTRGFPQLLTAYFTKSQMGSSRYGSTHLPTARGRPPRAARRVVNWRAVRRRLICCSQAMNMIAVKNPRATSDSRRVRLFAASPRMKAIATKPKTVISGQESFDEQPAPPRAGPPAGAGLGNPLRSRSCHHRRR
jgi:hypothetical protein